MQKVVLALAITLPALAFAGKAVNMPDGSVCIMSNRGDTIVSCSGGQSTPRQSSSSPQSCAELSRDISQISANLNQGLRGSEFERQKQLRRQYEDQYRSNCR